MKKTHHSSKKTSSKLERKNQIAYCVLALFLGQFGIHNFYVGRWKRGLAQLLLTLFSPLTLFVSFVVSDVWSIINIFTIHTDSEGNEFEPSSIAKWICGGVAILWFLTHTASFILGGIAGYQKAMEKYRATEPVTFQQPSSYRSPLRR